jgi:hypothetical protein
VRSDSDEETVLSVFFEAACPAFAGAGAGWSPGRLPIGVDGRVPRFLPWMEHAVTGSSVDPWRWHRIVSLPVGELGAQLTGVELLRLPGLADGTAVLRLQFVIASESPVMISAPAFANVEPLRIEKLLDLSAWLGANELRTGWGTSAVQRPLTDPPAVAELFCTTLDDPALLPEPSIRFEPETWTEAAYRMYTLTRDEPEPGPEDVVRGTERIVLVGGGVALVGGYRAVAMADFGRAVRVQRIAVETMFYAVAQNVMLKRLFEQAELLVEPTRNAGAAVALSRGVLAYRAVFWWGGGQRPEPEGELVAAYHDKNGLSELEADLASFETAVQAAISAQTNVLLGVIAVLGLAVAVAAAIVQAASWTGAATLWGVLVAAVVATIVLLLPTGRALRTSLLRG